MIKIILIAIIRIGESRRWKLHFINDDNDDNNKNSSNNTIFYNNKTKEEEEEQVLRTKW